MPRLSMIPTLFRETLCQDEFPREPEPTLVMDDQDQVNAYAEAGRIDGVMSAAYLFHSARISAVIAGKKKIIDLGCGPATQLAQIAQLNPESSFIGIDLSAEMLSDAKKHISELNVNNVEFMTGNITTLNGIDNNSIDAVISTMALHHLPSKEELQACFKEIKRVLKPDGAIYITDFGRLKSLKSVLFFAYLNKKFQPHSFSLDYERSLRAAFLRSDFANLASAELPINMEVVSTFGIPILVMIKTPDTPLSTETISTLKNMRKMLPLKYRRELDDIRLLFWLSGLRNDPFR